VIRRSRRELAKLLKKFCLICQARDWSKHNDVCRSWDIPLFLILIYKLARSSSSVSVLARVVCQNLNGTRGAPGASPWLLDRKRWTSYR